MLLANILNTHYNRRSPTAINSIKTRKYVHSWETQISANSLNLTPILTLDLLKPWFLSVKGFDKVLRTVLCQVSNHSDQGFSFYRANIPTNPYSPTT